MRARRHAALGDQVRLALVDDLATSDRSPSELSERHGVPSNLLAHHLDVLEDAGLIERLSSTGDARRRYVRLRLDALWEPGIRPSVPNGPVLFICSHNSARSQLAAAAWQQTVGTPVASAGTHPSNAVHPDAIAAATRAGLDLRAAKPRSIDAIEFEPSLVITVCDQAHEELHPETTWWHWSTPDPVEDVSPYAFDAALRSLQARIDTLGRSQ